MSYTSTKIASYEGTKTDVVDYISNMSSVSELNAEMSKEGFTGWYTSPNKGGVLLSDLNIIDGANIDLYSTTVSTHSLIMHTVQFVDYNGSILNTQSVEHGTSAIAPSNPTRTNFKFWKWDADYSSVLEDMTVMAKYVVVGEEYTFTYNDGTKSKTLHIEEESGDCTFYVKSYSVYSVEEGGGNLPFTISGADMTECTYMEDMEAYMVKVKIDANTVATLTQSQSGRTLSLTIKAGGSTVKIADFDHLVVRYYWSASDGRDLDTGTAFYQSGTPMDDKFVGWSMNSNYNAGDGLMTHGGDNVTSGNECVCIKFNDVYNKYYNELIGKGKQSIDLELWGTWFGSRGNGGVRIMLTAYKGGEMVQDPNNRYNKINEGGQKVAETFLDVNLTSAHGIGQWRSRLRTGYALMATVNYNFLTKTGRIFS